MNPLCIRNVIEWIRIEQNQVREPARLHGSEVGGTSEIHSTAQRGRLERFGWREPGLDQLTQFIVHARARKDETVSGIGSQHYRHARTVGVSRQAQALSIEVHEASTPRRG